MSNDDLITDYEARLANAERLREHVRQIEIEYRNVGNRLREARESYSDACLIAHRSKIRLISLGVLPCPNDKKDTSG
jgi:hypothetical protein